jgi:NADH dehydrogenase FAD-containing subunit
LCQDAVDLVRVALFALLKDKGVERVQGTVAAITATGVVVALAGGTTVELPADTVVVAFGLRPDPAVVEPLLDVVAESYLVGDCRQVGKILTANHDAFNVAVEV